MDERDVRMADQQPPSHRYGSLRPWREQVKDAPRQRTSASLAGSRALRRSLVDARRRGEPAEPMAVDDPPGTDDHATTPGAAQSDPQQRLPTGTATVDASLASLSLSPVLSPPAAHAARSSSCPVCSLVLSDESAWTAHGDACAAPLASQILSDLRARPATTPTTPTPDPTSLQDLLELVTPWTLQVDRARGRLTDSSPTGFVLRDPAGATAVEYAQLFSGGSLARSYAVLLTGLQCAHAHQVTRLSITSTDSTFLASLQGLVRANNTAIRSYQLSAASTLKRFLSPPTYEHLPSAQRHQIDRILQRSVTTTDPYFLCSLQTPHACWRPERPFSAAAPSTAAGGDSSTQRPHWTLRFDGLHVRSAAHGASSFVLLDAFGHTAHRCSRYIAGVAWTNIAIYQGLLDGLACATAHHVQHVILESDAQVVLAAIDSQTTTAHSGDDELARHLRMLAALVKAQLAHFTDVLLHAIPQDANSLAASLVAEALRSRLTTASCSLTTHSGNGSCWTPPQLAPTELPTTPLARELTGPAMEPPVRPQPQAPQHCSPQLQPAPQSMPVPFPSTPATSAAPPVSAPPATATNTPLPAAPPALPYQPDLQSSLPTPRREPTTTSALSPSPRAHDSTRLDDYDYGHQADLSAAVDEYKLFFDGACSRPNGHSGAGFVLYRPDGSTLCYNSRHLGGSTNNKAEYWALIDGLSCAHAHGISNLSVCGDSNLVLRQVLGEYSCHSDLRPLRDRARALRKLIGMCSLTHVDRAFNEAADKYARRGKSGASSFTCTDRDHQHGPCWTVQTELAALPTDEDMQTPTPAPARVFSPDALPSPVPPLGIDTFPARAQRLALPTNQPAIEKLSSAIELLADATASHIDTAADWTSAEAHMVQFSRELTTLVQHANLPRHTPPSSSTTPPNDAGTAAPRSHSTRSQTLSRAINHARDDRRSLRECSIGSVARKAEFIADRRIGRLKKAEKRQTSRALYMSKQAACLQEILAPADSSDSVPDRCPINASDLYGYFEPQAQSPTRFDFNGSSGAIFRDALASFTPSIRGSDSLLNEIQWDEIENALEVADRGSSPGLDGLPYSILCRFRLQLKPFLLAAYRSCWRHQQIPSTWKAAYVRLIYKKGNAFNPSNWRPICLQQTLYKLYTTILAQRFVAWMETNSRFSHIQKGFRSYNGCNEHNFISSCVTQHAKQQRKEVYAVWYDLQNAFGSIPQDYMWDVLRRLSVPPAFVECVSNIYSGSHFVVEAADGTTAPIPNKRGVYQGCPLSPYLFIAALTPLTAALESQESQHGYPLAPRVKSCSSAYADDLKVFSGTTQGIEKLHTIVADFLRWTGMRANASKCKFMAADPVAGAASTVPLRLKLHGEIIPRLSRGECYEYLGVHEGFDHTRERVVLQNLLSTMTKEATAVMISDLAPWQIVASLKTYVISKLEYPLRHYRASANLFQPFDVALAKGLRRVFRLSHTATNCFIHAPTASGGLGILPLAQLHAALQLTHGLQMLHSKDTKIAAVARWQLKTLIGTIYTIPPNDTMPIDELIQLYLNSELQLPRQRLQRSAPQSLWTDMQRTLLSFKLKLTFHDGDFLQLRVPHKPTVLDPTEWAREIKTHVKLDWYDKWTKLVDQGRTARLHGAQGSAFLSRSTDVHDASCRFAVAARLNLINTNTVMKRQGKSGTNGGRCRAPNCVEPETLGHVLNKCSFNRDAITKRHDDSLRVIASRLQKAMMSAARRHQILHVDQNVEGYTTPGPKRPDLQLIDEKKKTVAIVDLAICREVQATPDSDSSTFAASRSEKICKYQDIKDFFSAQGYQVSVDALVYGSVGSICRKNHAVYARLLGLPRNTITTLERELSGRHINASHKIWKTHAVSPKIAARTVSHATESTETTPSASSPRRPAASRRPARQSLAQRRDTSAQDRQSPAPARESSAPARLSPAPARPAPTPTRSAPASARPAPAPARPSAQGPRSAAPDRQIPAPAHRLPLQARQAPAPACPNERQHPDRRQPRQATTDSAQLPSTSTPPHRRPTRRDCDGLQSTRPFASGTSTLRESTKSTSAPPKQPRDGRLRPVQQRLQQHPSARAQEKPTHATTKSTWPSQSMPAQRTIHQQQPNHPKTSSSTATMQTKATTTTNKTVRPVPQHSRPTPASNSTTRTTQLPFRRPTRREQSRDSLTRRESNTDNRF